MGKQKGLLEESFADALLRASHTDSRFKCVDTSEYPGVAPRSELEIVQEVLEFYRANQELVDAAVQSGTSFVETREGLSHVKALEGSLAGGEWSPLSGEIAGRIWDDDAFRGTRAQVTQSGLRTVGIGVSGDAFAWFGKAGGAEGLMPFAVVHTARTWHTTIERELVVGVSAGMSLSFWWDFPMSGCIFGLVVQLALGGGLRVMLIRQRTVDDADATPGAVPKPKFPIAGFAVQFGLGFSFPGIAAGYYVGNQKARERVPDLSISVTNATTGGNTITVNTEASLSVAVSTGNIAYTLGDGTTLTLNMPYYFTEEEVSAMTISDLPSTWTYAASETNLVLTCADGGSWDARSTPLTFTIGNVESSGTIGTGTIEEGLVTATLDTTTETKYAVAALDLAWAQFSASVTWSAQIGDDDYFTFVTPCTGASSCSGGPVTAYSQSSYKVTPLLTATDTDGNTWEFGYQFNYTGDDNTPQIRAVMWQEDTSVAVIPNSGLWIDSDHSGTTSTATYDKSTGNTTFSITPIYNS